MREEQITCLEPLDLSPATRYCLHNTRYFSQLFCFPGTILSNIKYWALITHVIYSLMIYGSLPTFRSCHFQASDLSFVSLNSIAKWDIKVTVL